MVIARLHQLVEGILVPEAGVEVVHRQRAAGYSVFHYGFSSGGSLAAPSSGEGVQDPFGVYERASLELAFDDIRYRLRTVYSLPEFDTLAYHTRLMAGQLLDGRRRPRHVLVRADDVVSVLGNRAGEVHREATFTGDCAAAAATEALTEACVRLRTNWG